MDRQDDFRRWSDAFVRPAITPDEQLASMGQLQAFAASMQQLVAERRQNPRDSSAAWYACRWPGARRKGSSAKTRELFG
jgi:hypothetical protein